MGLFKIILIVIACQAFWSCSAEKEFHSGRKAISHDRFDSLLGSCVSEEGLVDYGCFLARRDEFQSYLDQLSENYPDDRIWKLEEKLAYWINAYNAFTIDLILNNYPVSSIKSIKSGIQIPFINSIWDQKNIALGPNLFCLNDIEHEILREEFEEPRIHFAINCASISCPQLLNTAFDAEKIFEQLERQTKIFVNDPTKNRYSKGVFKVSKIFSWFRFDFGGNEGVKKLLKKYYDGELPSEFRIEHLEYNWALNEARKID